MSLTFRKIFTSLRKISSPLTVFRVANMKPREPGEKPKPENLGLGQAGFYLIELQVSQVRPEKTQNIRVWSDLGFFLGFCTL